MYENAIAYEGLEDGKPVFQMFLCLPDPLFHDQPATARQRSAVERFYCFAPAADFTETQSHALMCARDYAIEFTKMTAPHLRSSTRQMFERLTAAFILSENKVMHSVRYWSEKLFDSGEEFYIPPMRAPFAEVFQFQHHIFSCILNDGVKIDDLK